ncbi:PREDICTED: uncharacterized protein LOC108372269, partial [Rhagoletis zephyria]|uniref:uncharacterized protein LOC108372269 n=1 Tax=Rhagoletis zephyria TaxID=28612 RepID=UPI00081137A6
MSDHMHIEFDMGLFPEHELVFRNPRKANWELFRFTKEEGGNSPKHPITTKQELENEAEQLHSDIVIAFNSSCPQGKVKSKRDVPWWSKKLEQMRCQARRLFNRAKNTGDWNPYKLALTYYKELRKSKRASWRNHCEEINSLPEAVRLQKPLTRDYRNTIATLKRPDGSYTQHPGETSRPLLDTHFPRCISGYCRPELGAPTSTSRREQSLATKLSTVERVQWALSTFSPYKSPGPDGIYPCLLQHGIRHIAPVLSKLYRASLLLGHIPSIWSEVKVVFLPKMGKPEQLPSSYRPISLSSFLLKGMEKILD